MIITLLSAALAQDIVSQGETPQFNSQVYRPAIDSHHFLWVNETELGTQSSFNYRTTFSYASSPIVYTDYTGKSTPLIDSLSQVDISAGYAMGRFRYAVTAPLILNASGSSLSEDGSSLGLGEAMADIKWQLLDRHDHRMGFALNGRSSLPTSTIDSALGTDGLMYEVEGALDMHFGKTALVFNLGHRHQPEVVTEDVTWGNQLFSRVGYAVPLGPEEEHGVALEANYSGLYSDMQWGGNGVALESMLSGWFAIHHAVQFRAGISKGLGAAMTTPNWRGVLAVSVLHRTEKDSDADGIVDHEDQCIYEAEDHDGYEDSDGCPDPTKVNVLVMDHMDHEVRDAHWHSTDGRFAGPGHSSFYMQAGTVELNIDDEKYNAAPTTFQIRDQAEQNIFFEVDLVMGSLMVVVKDENENVIPDATWSIDGIKGALFQPTGSVVPLKPGEHEVVVVADGYRMVKKTIEVHAKKTEVVHLSTSVTKVTRDLKILDKIYFKTNSAEIDERSHILLDEVADVLNHYHLIELVHIEGHTDSQGSAEYNKKLSQDRAAAVKTYLLEKGVEPERLEAIGYGESKPIASNDTEQGRHDNRRVIFEIKKVYKEGSFGGEGEKLELKNNASEEGKREAVEESAENAAEGKEEAAGENAESKEEAAGENAESKEDTAPAPEEKQDAEKSAE